MKENDKDLIANLIGSSLEVCYHGDDGTEKEYWYIQSGSSECVEAFDTEEEAVEECEKIGKMIDAEIERREAVSQAAATLGRMTSERKKKTSAENGRKSKNGGRPRKNPEVTE